MNVVGTTEDKGHNLHIAEILDGFGDGFLAFDFDWRVAYCNRAGEKLFGFRREDVIGQVFWKVYPAPAGSRVRRFLDGAMASREPSSAELPSELQPGRWFTLRTFPIEAGLGVSFRDVTGRRERRRREREQAERLELALETSGFGDWSWDAESDLVDMSPRAAEVYGIPAGPVKTWTALREMIHPDDREASRDRGQAAMEARKAYEVEYRIIRPTDGQERWVLVRAQGRYDEDGHATGLLGVAADITEAKTNDARIRADRERLAELERRRAYLLEIADALRLVENPQEVLVTATQMIGERLNVGRAGYIEVDEDHNAVVRGSWNLPHLEDMTGRNFQIESFGPTLLQYMTRGLDLVVDDVHLDTRTQSATRAYDAIGLRSVLAVPLVRNGRLDAIFFVHDVKPRIWSREDLALVEDVATRTWSALARARVERRAEERQRLLINELNHRVKNTLATIQGLAHQTLRDGLVSREARDRLTERLLALSAAHNVLTNANWESADLREIVRQAVRPYDDPPGSRIAASGPPARLAPNVALAVSMALHELATNAVKYGALSAPQGGVTLEWKTSPEGGVEIEWREHGGPPVEPPTSLGFGSRLLSSLTAELGGPADISYDRSGVVCRLRAPTA